MIKYIPLLSTAAALTLSQAQAVLVFTTDFNIPNPIPSGMNTAPTAYLSGTTTRLNDFRFDATDSGRFLWNGGNQQTSATAGFNNFDGSSLDSLEKRWDTPTGLGLNAVFGINYILYADSDPANATTGQTILAFTLTDNNGDGDWDPTDTAELLGVVYDDSLDDSFTFNSGDEAAVRLLLEGVPEPSSVLLLGLAGLGFLGRRNRV